MAVKTHPRTLAEAHELLDRLRPKLAEPLDRWLAFRQQAARIYTDVADVDRFHHHEACYWAYYEREKADAIRREIAGGHS